jgi:carbon monoxide dehydrogenase subunit G
MALKVSEEIEIVAPPERVWPYLASERGLAAWNDALARLEPPELRAGERCRIVLRAGPDGVEQAQEATVVTCEPGRQLGFELTGGNLPPGVALRVDLQLHPEGAGTRLVLDAIAQVPGFLAALAGPMLLPRATAELRAAAARLKEAVEGGR